MIKGTLRVCDSDVTVGVSRPFAFFKVCQAKVFKSFKKYFLYLIVHAFSGFIFNSKWNWIIQFDLAQFTVSGILISYNYVSLF